MSSSREHIDDDWAMIGMVIQGRLRAGRALLLTLVVLVALGGCTSGQGPDAPRPGATKSSADGSVHTVVGGITVEGGPGSVTGDGALQISASSDAHPDFDAIPVAQVGAGVDVSVPAGARLTKPLTVSFPASAPHTGWEPVVAHRLTDGSWELRQVSWDGRVATLTTDQFSPNVLVWLDPSQLTAWVKEKLANLLIGRKKKPHCPGNPHPWSNIADQEDLVHACLTTNDSESAGERAELRLTPNRGAYVEVTVPKGADYVWVKDQTSAFRHAVAHLPGMEAHDPDRTVFLGPDDEMTVGWRKPAPGQDREPVVDVKASTAAMLLTLFEGTLDFDGFSVRAERQAALMIVPRCALKVEGSVFKDMSGVLDGLACLGEGAAGNLSDPATARGAAADFLGPLATQGELADQTKRLEDLGGKLAATGHLIKVIGVVKSVRTALLATYGTISDQVQTVALGGGGTTIVLHLHTPLQRNDPKNRLGWKLSTAGLGPLLLGMPATEAVPLGVPHRVGNLCGRHDAWADAGRLVGPNGRGASTVWTNDGKLDEIRVDSPAFATRRGARVGDRLSDVARIYGQQATRETDGTAAGSVLVVRDSSGGYVEFGSATGADRVEVIDVSRGEFRGLAGRGDC